MKEKLSTKAWEKSTLVIENIIKHPFNQQLLNGTLEKEKFLYYIEQDSVYLQDFARANAVLASKMPIEHTRKFLNYALGAFIVETEVVHSFFTKQFNATKSNNITLATLTYTSYMLKNCILESKEIGIATILPCFWIYKEVGDYMYKNSTIKNNIYAKWIDTYASEEFAKSVNEAIEVFNELANLSTEHTKQEMLKAFYTSATLEWHFWNDSYNLNVFDNIK